MLGRRIPAGVSRAFWDKPVNIPPEVLQAARQQVLVQLRSCQDKIREQRRELKRVGRAHQMLWMRFKELDRDRTYWLKSWTAATAQSSRAGEELRRSKGWTLGQYMRWLSGIRSEAR